MKPLNLRFLVAVATLMLLFGCSSQPESLTSETDLAPQSVDEQFVAVAKVFPGFAGLFYKDDGGLVLNVAPPPGSSARASFTVTDVLEDKVLAAALDLLSDDLLILGYSSRKMAEKAMLSKAKLKDLVEVRPVTYDYLSLASWYDKAVKILGSDTVVSSDIDERVNRIVYGIEELGRVPDVQRKLTALSVPLGAVTFKQETPPELLTQDTSPVLRPQASVNDYQRELRGGIQIAPFAKNCTLGFNAYRNGVLGFVTANHCTWSYGTVNSGEYGTAWQPEEGFDQYRIGYESADPGYRWLSGCPNSRCRLSDSAFYRYSTSRPKPLGKIANVALNSWTINSTYPNRTISRERSRQSVYVGLGIHKLGATTGHRLGKITGTCSSALEQGTSDRFILCEVMHDAPSDGGDSGGPVWVERPVFYSCPNPPQGFPGCIRIETDLLGIHWRRGGGVSPIWDIEAELGALKTY